MFNKFRMGAAGAAIVAAFGMASVAGAVTTSAPVGAEILESLTLTVQTGSSLDFGQIATTGAGTVTVSTAGNVTCSGLVVCPSSGISAVGLDIGGNAGAVVHVALPATTAILTDGTNTMALSGLNLSDSSVTLTGGAGSFTVGGTLAVGNGQQSGTYSGGFTVQVEYQ